MDDKKCMIHLTFAVWLKKYACTSTVYTVTLYICIVSFARKFKSARMSLMVQWSEFKMIYPDLATTFKSSGTDPLLF